MFGSKGFMNTIVSDAAVRGWQLALFSPVYGFGEFGSTLSDFRDSAEEYVDYGQMRETEQAVARLNQELNRRLALLADHKVGNYRFLPDDVRPARLLILFDDLDKYAATIITASEAERRPSSDQPRIDMMNGGIRRTLRTLFRIAVAGRSAGISVVIAGRHIDRNLLGEFPGGLMFLRHAPKVLLGVVPVAGLVDVTDEREASALQKMLINRQGEMRVGDGVFDNPTSGGFISVIHARLDNFESAGCLVKCASPAGHDDGCPPMEERPQDAAGSEPCGDLEQSENNGKDGIAFFYADKDLAKSLALGVAAVSLALAAVATMFARRR